MSNKQVKFVNGWVNPWQHGFNLDFDKKALIDMINSVDGDRFKVGIKKNREGKYYMYLDEFVSQPKNPSRQVTYDEASEDNLPF